MLGRLLKYELRSTSRIMLFIYGAVIAMGLLLGLAIRARIYFGKVDIWSTGLEPAGSGITFTSILVMSLILIYVLLLTAMSVLTIVFIILRFYNNLLQGQGYLMHTLPVPTWMHVVSKLLVAIIWELLIWVVTGISVVILGASSGAIGYILKEIGFREIWETLYESFGMNVFTFLLTCFIGMVLTIIHYYFCMAVGNLANRNKMLWAVVTYIATQAVFSIVGTVLGASVLALFEYTPEVMIWRLLIVNTVAAALCFAGTVYILKNKLNLA